MNVQLAYGHGHIAVDFPEGRTTIIEPMHREGLVDERQALLAALDSPIAAAPLRDWIKPDSRICIVFTDITRATPNSRIIPWILEYLSFVPRDQITLLSATGTHRGNTPAEMEELLTPEVARNYRVLNHDCRNRDELKQFGETKTGAQALINRHLADADVRIITGFLEPHIFAGFSGGVKGIMPGVAGLETIVSNHNASNIGHPNATFGILDDNPVWQELKDIALRVGPSFLINVAMNEVRGITGVFAGDLVKAHRVGAQFVKDSCMQRVAEPFDIVVSTNSGFPLDLNLYQGGKGMTAGARILKKGGMVILACECSQGVPDGSPLQHILDTVKTPDEIFALLATPGYSKPEQWQAQLQALVQKRARVFVYSSLSDETIQRCLLQPCHDIGAMVHEELEKLGPTARVAVLPCGPSTVPYLEKE